MSSMTAGGISSGEVKSIVSQLQQRIDAPIQTEQAQIKTDKTEISALGKVKGVMSSLNSALSGISDPSSINPMQASVSTKSASAKAAASATSGSYALSNIKLAKAQEVYSSAYASASAKVGSGSGALTFKFGSGGSSTINIGSSSDTVSGVAAAINKANAGVKASVVSTASGAQLVLTGTKPGSQKSFTVSGTGATAGLSYAGSGSASTLTLAQGARNASFTMNGVPVTETSNSGINLVKGVTLSLKSSGSATVSVNKSAQTLSSALSSVTSKLNKAVSTIAKETKYTPGSSASTGSKSSSSGSSKGKAGPLLGNVQVEDLQQNLVSGISSLFGSGLSAASIGLTVSSHGKVSFNASTFSAAYKKNPTAVNNLVKQLQTNVKNVVTGAIGTGSSTSSGSGSGVAGSGFLTAISKDRHTNVTSLQSQISQQQTEGKQQIANLESQFNSAISASSTSQTTLSYLNALMGSGNSSSSGG